MNINTKFKTFLKQVEYVRKLQRDFYKCDSSTRKSAILRECKACEKKLDEALIEMHSILDAEQLDLFAANGVRAAAGSKNETV